MKKIAKNKPLKLYRKPFYKSVVFGINIVSQNRKHINRIREALLLLKNTDRRLFSKVLCLKAILIYPGKDEYGAVFEKERIYVDQPETVEKASLVWLASSLVHEAWHIDQYKRGIRKYGIKTEKGAYLVQRRFLSKVGSKEDIKWLDKMYKLQWWESESTAFKKDIGYDDKSVDKTWLEFWNFLGRYKTKKLRLIDINL